MSTCETFLKPVHWPSSTAWGRYPWLSVLVSLPRTHESYSNYIGTRTPAFGTGQMPRSTMPCYTDICTRPLAGGFIRVMTRIPVHYEISLCRPTELRCCGSPVAWPSHMGCRCAHPC